MGPNRRRKTATSIVGIESNDVIGIFSPFRMITYLLPLVLYE